MLKYFFLNEKKVLLSQGIKNPAWNHNWKADNKPHIFFDPVILVIFSYIIFIQFSIINGLN